MSNPTHTVRIVETAEYFYEIHLPDKLAEETDRQKYVQDTWIAEPEHNKYPSLIDRQVEIYDGVEG